MKKTQGQQRQHKVNLITYGLFALLSAIAVFALEKYLHAGWSSFTIYALILTSYISWEFNKLVSALYVRESDAKLNDGFYTDNSWLDVEDNKLVLIDEEKVQTAYFSDGKRQEITQAYQNGASHEDLIALFKPSQVQSILFTELTSLKSRHDQDTIALQSNDNYISLDFLNFGTKAHALKQLELLLPKSGVKTVDNRSRLRAAAPRLAMLGVLGAIGFRANDILIWGFAGALAGLFIIPTLIKRLLSPTVVTEYTFRPTANTRKVDQDQLPKAA